MKYLLISTILYFNIYKNIIEVFISSSDPRYENLFLVIIIGRFSGCASIKIVFAVFLVLSIPLSALKVCNFKLSRHFISHLTFWSVYIQRRFKVLCFIHLLSSSFLCVSEAPLLPPVKEHSM